jgi:hypothetical protein
MVEVVLTGSRSPKEDPVDEFMISQRKKKIRKKRHDISSVQYFDNSE